VAPSNWGRGTEKKMFSMAESWEIVEESLTRGTKKSIIDQNLYKNEELLRVGELENRLNIKR